MKATLARAAALGAILYAPVPLHAAVTQTNLVSDGTIAAAHTDPNLVNAWGISYSPGGPFWVSDNGTGLTTLYTSDGTPQSLVVSIPNARNGSGPSGPSGQVFNGTPGFGITSNGATGSSFFIFVTENGTISGWNPSVDPNAITRIDNSASGAAYKGAALYTDKSGAVLLLAANFTGGTIEVYAQDWRLRRTFRDPNLPNSYAPFNVAVLNGHIYVAYAKRKPGAIDNESGPGLGYLEEVDPTGRVVHLIAAHGALDAPWGMAIAPASFGRFAGKLLVGNFGNGWINAWDPATYKPLGALRGTNGYAVAIDGLWGLIPGNGGSGGDANALYFTAGPNGETHGLLGSLTWVK